jgi:hypothetical protein
MSKKGCLKKLISSALISNFAIFSHSLYACDINGKTGFLPDNTFNIPVGQKASGGITENTFNKVIDKINSIYSEIVKEKGGNLVFDKKWEDGTVNALAHREGNEGKDWVVSMYGGLARQPLMNADGLALVVCHELGHHIGGIPTKKIGNSWASSEGQADYFATLKCLRRYFKDEDNVGAIKKMKVTPEAQKQCQLVYSNEEEMAVCIRSAMAGLNLAQIFRSLFNEKKAVNFSTPDTNVVTINFDKHPASQCRLDTYFEGSLCDKSVEEDVSYKDENIGTCSVKNGDQIGSRPLCWFAPAA